MTPEINELDPAEITDPTSRAILIFTQWHMDEVTDADEARSYAEKLVRQLQKYGLCFMSVLPQTVRVAQSHKPQRSHSGNPDVAVSKPAKLAQHQQKILNMIPAEGVKSGFYNRRTRIGGKGVNVQSLADLVKMGYLTCETIKSPKGIPSLLYKKVEK